MPNERGGKRSVLIRLGRYMMRFRLPLAMALLLTVCANLLALVGPKLSGNAVDCIGLDGTVDYTGVFRYCGLMALCYAASAALSYLLARLMIRISRNVVYQMRADLFNKLMTLPVGFYDVNQTGDILSRISYDTETINTSLSNDLIQVLASLVTIVGSLVMMLSISPVLVLVFAVTVPLSVLISRFIAKHTRPLFRARSKKLGELNGLVEEMISGQKTLAAYCQEKRAIASEEVKNQEAVESYRIAEYYGSMMGPSVNFINNLSLSFISVFGVLLVMTGRMSIGNISSFVLYSRKFSGPINEIANIFGDLQSALAASERVFRLLDEMPEPPDDADAEELGETEGDVALEHVSFCYEPGKTILHDLSLHAEPGSLVAIVGPTGAGKTTIINLLMRFYDTREGRITVDGREISQLRRDSLRLAFAMVLQDTWLFEGTVAENIAYGRPDCTREEIEEAAKTANIHNMILALPDGYDTVLTDNGTNISKGQKQLLTITRAMLIHANMLILDEATSNVDVRTEYRIQQAMRRLMRDKTCFVVAHRLSTIRSADCILVVRDGDVVERGTHQELMQQNGFYRELYDAQYQ